MQRDKPTLQIAGFFHFVLGGVVGLFSQASTSPVALAGVGMLYTVLADPASDNAGFFLLYGLLFTIIAILIIVFGWVFTVCLMMAGYFILKRRNYTYCLIMAGIACIFIPFGTVLGVFSILLLLQPEVKALFMPTLPPVVEPA